MASEVVDSQPLINETRLVSSGSDAFPRWAFPGGAGLQTSQVALQGANSVGADPQSDCFERSGS